MAWDGFVVFSPLPLPHYQDLRVQLAVNSCAVKSSPVVYQQIVKSLS